MSSSISYPDNYIPTLYIGQTDMSSSISYPDTCIPTLYIGKSVLPSPCDLPIVAKALWAHDYVSTMCFDCTIGHNIEVAIEEMDVRKKE